MKRTVAFDLLKKFRDQMNAFLGDRGKIVFAPDMPVGFGRTYDGIEHSQESEVGTAGLGFDFKEDDSLQYPTFQKGLRKLFRIGTVDDLSVTEVLVDSGHEAKHNLQQSDDFHGKTDDPGKAKYMALNFLACTGNPGYYTGFGNLYQNPRDIDAEKFGIDMTRVYLTDQLGDPKKADQMIIDYVNNRTDENHTYYFSRPEGGFKSVEQIDELFDKAFEDSKSGMRMYRTGEAAWDFHDMNAKFLDDRYDAYAGACVNAMNSTYGEEKDRLMAAVSLKQDPSYARYVSGLIKPEELSMKKVFSLYFTEDQNEQFFGIKPAIHEEEDKPIHHFSGTLENKPTVPKRWYKKGTVPEKFEKLLEEDHRLSGGMRKDDDQMDDPS